jgi:chloramphenicol 3-O-phosphotransferase
LGALIAAELPFSAFIEVDELHYKIVSGRVSWQGGISPLDEPLEYKRQRKLAEDNAVRLAVALLEAGFDCVIDNLSEAFAPDAAWATRTFSGRRIFRVLLFCNDKTMQSRLKARHGCSYSSLIGRSSNRASASAQTFDLAVDTSCDGPESIAKGIVAMLGLGRSST